MSAISWADKAFCTAAVWDSSKNLFTAFQVGWELANLGTAPPKAISRFWPESSLAEVLVRLANVSFNLLYVTCRVWVLDCVRDMRKKIYTLVSPKLVWRTGWKQQGGQICTFETHPDIVWRGYMVCWWNTHYHNTSIWSPIALRLFEDLMSLGCSNIQRLVAAEEIRVHRRDGFLLSVVVMMSMPTCICVMCSHVWQLPLHLVFFSNFFGVRPPCKTFVQSACLLQNRHHETSQ